MDRRIPKNREDHVDNTLRVRLTLHGAIVLLVGLVAGLGAVTDVPGQPGREWTSVHQTLLVTGVWMLTTASASVFLTLPRREAAGLVWSLSSAGYALILSLVLQATTGVRGISPDGSVANWLAFVANIVVVIGGLLAALLTVAGARASLRAGVAAGVSPRSA